MRYENQKLEGLTFDLDDDEIIGCHLVDCSKSRRCKTSYSWSWGLCRIRSRRFTEDAAEAHSITLSRASAQTGTSRKRSISNHEAGSSLPKQSPVHPVNTGDRPSVPLEVFYVVQTSSGAVGKRHHRVCPPLYETRHQAQVDLIHRQTASSGTGTYSIWKATTYVEPAEWLYDVVVANGLVAQPCYVDLTAKCRRLHSPAAQG
jgi:hypothetical protein